MDALNIVAIVVSVSAGIPALIASLAVIYVFRSAAKLAPKTAEEWLISGIVLGFLGEVLDQGYWQVAWTAFVIGLDAGAPLLEYGSIPNIPFRQAATIGAAYCHIKGASMRDPGVRKLLTTLIGGGLLAGGLYGLWVTWLLGGLAL